MKYRRLFDLRVRHDYDPDGRCHDLRVDPRAWHPDGARALARHRLLARPLPDGVEVVAPVDDASRPVVGFAEDLRLSFDVRVTGADFPHYTDLGAWAGLARPIYRGRGAAGGALDLGSETLTRPPDVAAGVEIRGITSEWLAAPPRFTLELQASQALWVFYLLTDRPGDALPQIEDGDPERALAFGRQLLSPESVTAADDPVGHRLLARHPGRRCFRMISSSPIACRRAPLRGLALRLGDELLLRELSNPLMSSRSTVTAEPAAVPRNSLYRVIEY